MGLGSGVSVAVAGSCSSDSTPSLGSFICHGCSPKKTKKKRKEKKKKEKKIRKFEFVWLFCTGCKWKDKAK